MGKKKRKLTFAAYNELIYLFIVLIFFSVVSTAFYNMIVLTTAQTKKTKPTHHVFLIDQTDADSPEHHVSISELRNNTMGVKECDRCFQHNFTFILDNQDICSTSKESGFATDIDILILITSSLGHFARRNAIRKTWLTPTRNNTSNVRYAFLFGISDSASDQKMLEEEYVLYKDILQEDFMDSYKNLTFKAVMGLRWASTRCPHAWHVMKTDDDMFINIPGVLYALKSHSGALQTAIGGTCPNMAFPVRNNRSKWYVDFETYPKQYYPKYCSGTAYITSSRAAQKLFAISENITYFPIEDIYLSFCVKKLGFQFRSISGFHRHFVEPENCNYKTHGLLTSHGLSPGDMKAIWEMTC